MKKYNLAFLFPAFFLFFSGLATADPISVTFSTRAKIGEQNVYTTNAAWNSSDATGDTSSNFTVNFAGDSYNVTLVDPSYAINQSFGQISVTKSRDGGGPVSDIPFDLQVTQSVPTPDSSDPIVFSANFSGTIFSSGSVVLNFASFSDDITSGGLNINYSILDVSKTITMTNTGASNVFDIYGHLAVAPAVLDNGAPNPVPEPTSDLLFGTGLAALGAILWGKSAIRIGVNKRCNLPS